MILHRQQYTEKGIFGRLLNDNHEEICKTLEHAYPDEGTWVAKVPGHCTYLCKRGMHHLPNSYNHYFDTFEVMDIPGHSGILFHPGNFNQDSAGCILLGTKLYHQDGKALGISDSRSAFKKFMSLLTGRDTFTLWVTNDPELIEEDSKKAS